MPSLGLGMDGGGGSCSFETETLKATVVIEPVEPVDPLNPLNPLNPSNPMNLTLPLLNDLVKFLNALLSGFSNICVRYFPVAPAVFVGDPPPKDGSVSSSSGGVKLPLDRAVGLVQVEFSLPITPIA
jgi:hypothetical protein